MSNKPMIGSNMHKIVNRRYGKNRRVKVSSYENKRAIADAHADFASTHGMPVPE
jgi:hypothetical protein